jgi:hypothetical protein
MSTPMTKENLGFSATFTGSAGGAWKRCRRQLGQVNYLNDNRASHMRGLF